MFPVSPSAMRDPRTAMLMVALALGFVHGGFFADLGSSPIPNLTKRVSEVLTIVAERLKKLDEMTGSVEAYNRYVELYLQETSEEVERLRQAETADHPMYKQEIFVVATKGQKMLLEWYDQFFPDVECHLTQAMEQARVASVEPTLGYATANGRPSYAAEFGLRLPSFRPYDIHVTNVEKSFVELDTPLFSFSLG